MKKNNLIILSQMLHRDVFEIHFHGCSTALMDCFLDSLIHGCSTCLEDCFLDSLNGPSTGLVDCFLRCSTGLED